MAVKKVILPDIGEVHLYKRKGSRSIRLSLTSDGRIRVTLPTYAPYQAALAFVTARRDWIVAHRPVQTGSFENGQEIGKYHRLLFTASFDRHNVSSRVGKELISVHYPATLDSRSEAVQLTVEKAAVKALRQEAEDLLPARVRQMAERTGFSYKSVLVKKLKGRWGSCDQYHNIVLNLFLMQLPWELIDYVFLQELVHTEHLNHGQDFWASFLSHEPEAKSLRRQIKQFQPMVIRTPVA
jgi:predicted metal-dependent hydrolase